VIYRMKRGRGMDKLENGNTAGGRVRPAFIIYNYQTGEKLCIPDEEDVVLLSHDLRGVFFRDPNFHMVEVEEFYSFGKENTSVVYRGFQDFGVILVSSLCPRDAREYISRFVDEPEEYQCLLDEIQGVNKKLTKGDFRDRVTPVLKYKFSDSGVDIETLDPTYSGVDKIKKTGLLSYYMAPIYACDMLKDRFFGDLLFTTSERELISLHKFAYFPGLGFVMPVTYYHVVDLDRLSGTVFRQVSSGKHLSEYLKRGNP